MGTSALEDLRRKSGKSLGRILTELRFAAPEIAPSQRSGIINWEKQGITDVRVIRALSKLYGSDFDTVEQAALESRRRFLAIKERKKLLQSATNA